MDESMNTVAGARSDLNQRLSSPELRRLVEKMVRRKVPAVDVEDVVQTVLCDALTAVEPPSDDEQLRKWLAGITRHKVADFHRAGSKARHVELPEQLAASEAPQSAREWANWADKQAAGDPDEQRTLGWMAREGGGEKLAHIAADEKLPPTQVRQRVSRLRRLMRQRWAAELAAVAAVLVVALVMWQLLRDGPVATPTPQPVPEVVPPQVAPEIEQGRRLRADALQACGNEAWRACIEGLDAAAALDPAGDDATEVHQARKIAGEGLKALEDAEPKEPRETNVPVPSKVDPPPKPSSTAPVKPAPPPKPIEQQLKKKAPPTNELPTKNKLPTKKKAPPSQQPVYGKKGALDDPGTSDGLGSKK